MPHHQPNLSKHQKGHSLFSASTSEEHYLHTEPTFQHDPSSLKIPQTQKSHLLHSKNSTNPSSETRKKPPQGATG